MTSGPDLFTRLTPAKADRRPRGSVRALPPWFQVVFLLAKVGGVVALYWLMGSWIGWWTVLLSASLLSIIGALMESFYRSARFAVTASLRTWALRVLGPGVWVLAATTIETWYLRLFLVVSAIPFGVSLLRRSQSHDESSSVMMRNQRAHATYADLRKDEKAACEPFCLYLRPFASKQRLLAEVPGSLHPVGRHHLDFEAVLCRALKGHYPVLSLGKESEELDLAARIDVDENEWQDAVKVLARHAGLIVIVPLHYKGTEWELDWLIDSGLSDKLVCVLPESSYPTSGLGWSFIRTSPGQNTTPLRAPLVLAHLFGLPRFEISFRQNAQSLEQEGEMAFLNYLKIAMELPLEWRRFVDSRKEGRFSLPILTATGALFRAGSDPATPGRIFPLALSLVRHKDKKGWLLKALTALGLLPGLGNSGAVSWIRTVLGKSKDPWLLLLCAESFVVWDMLEEAVECFTLVREASQIGCEMARRYLTAIPILISEREAMLGVQLRSSYERFVARLLDTDQQWERHPELRAACTVSLSPDEDARKMAMQVMGPAFVEFKNELAHASENPPG